MNRKQRPSGHLRFGDPERGAALSCSFLPIIRQGTNMVSSRPTSAESAASGGLFGCVFLGFALDYDRAAALKPAWGFAPNPTRDQSLDPSSLRAALSRFFFHIMRHQRQREHIRAAAGADARRTQLRIPPRQAKSQGFALRLRVKSRHSQPRAQRRILRRCPLTQTPRALRAAPPSPPAPRREAESTPCAARRCWGRSVSA